MVVKAASGLSWMTIAASGMSGAATTARSPGNPASVTRGRLIETPPAYVPARRRIVSPGPACCSAKTSVERGRSIQPVPLRSDPAGDASTWSVRGTLPVLNGAAVVPCATGGVTPAPGKAYSIVSAGRKLVKLASKPEMRLVETDDPPGAQPRGGADMTSRRPLLAASSAAHAATTAGSSRRSLRAIAQLSSLDHSDEVCGGSGGSSASACASSVAAAADPLRCPAPSHPPRPESW